MSPWGRAVRVTEVGERCPVCRRKFLAYATGVVAVARIVSLWGVTYWQDTQHGCRWWAR